MSFCNYAAGLLQRRSAEQSEQREIADSSREEQTETAGKLYSFVATSFDEYICVAALVIGPAWSPQQ